MRKCCEKSRLGIVGRTPDQWRALVPPREEVSKGQEQTGPWKKEEAAMAGDRACHHGALKGTQLCLCSLISSSYSPMR